MRRFIRGIPVSRVRQPASPAPQRTFVINMEEHLGRNPETCRHTTVVRGNAFGAPDVILQQYGVPPGDRAVVFLADPEGPAKACKLCGAVQPPGKAIWVLLEDA